MKRSRWAVCFALAGTLIVAVAVCAQDAPGASDEVAAELAAVAAWEAAPEYAAATPNPATRGVQDTVYFSNFDSDDGGLVGTIDWEWGTSYSWTGVGCYNTSYHQPPAPYSGAGMWGTILNTCYTDQGNNAGYATCVNTNPSDDSILTLTVDLTNYTAATLSWYEWYDLFSGFDWGELRINGAQAFVDCRSSYIAPTSWVLRTVDLASYLGGVATIEWHMMSSTVVNYAGWYLDDVLVEGTPVPVELQSLSID